MLFCIRSNLLITCFTSGICTVNMELTLGLVWGTNHEQTKKPARTIAKHCAKPQYPGRAIFRVGEPDQSADDIQYSIAGLAFDPCQIPVSQVCYNAPLPAVPAN